MKTSNHQLIGNVIPANSAFTRRASWIVAMGVLILFPAIVAAQETTRVSVDSSGSQSNGKSERPAVSADGRYIAFESGADNLVSGDNNGVDDVFVKDLLNDTVVRISVSSSGAEGDAQSGRPSVSSDGRYIAFFSDSSNFASGDTDTFDPINCTTCTGSRDVFIHDRDPDGNGTFDENNGTTTRVSESTSGAAGNGNSTRPALSGDGQIIAFRSAATNLITGDVNGVNDIFVHDVQAGATALASISTAGGSASAKSDRPAISSDGRYIAFYSDAFNLVTDDTNAIRDLFVYEVNNGNVVRVSMSSSGTEGNGSSSRPGISSDGRYVVFRSAATNLTSGDGNGFNDIFIHDRDPDVDGIFDDGNSITELISNGTSGDANGASDTPVMSSDGRYVSFASTATNLISDDGNLFEDVFVHDRNTNNTTRVSVCSGGFDGDGISARPSMSSSGRVITFQSVATNLVSSDSNIASDVFVHDLDALPMNTGSCSSGPAGAAPSACGSVGMISFALLFSGLMGLRWTQRKDWN